MPKILAQIFPLRISPQIPLSCFRNETGQVLLWLSLQLGRNHENSPDEDFMVISEVADIILGPVLYFSAERTQTRHE